jgi:hypothetical protein
MSYISAPDKGLRLEFDKRDVSDSEEEDDEEEEEEIIDYFDELYEKKMMAG